MAVACTSLLESFKAAKGSGEVNLVAPVRNVLLLLLRTSKHSVVASVIVWQAFCVGTGLSSPKGISAVS